MHREDPHGELGLTTVGLVSSLIVDHQIIDLDRSRGQSRINAVVGPPYPPLTRRVVRPGGLRAVTPLRAVHNGSVNGYAGYAIGGRVVVIAVLAWP